MPPIFGPLADVARVREQLEENDRDLLELVLGLADEVSELRSQVTELAARVRSPYVVPDRSMREAPRDLLCWPLLEQPR